MEKSNASMGIIISTIKPLPILILNYKIRRNDIYFNKKLIINNKNNNFKDDNNNDNNNDNSITVISTIRISVPTSIIYDHNTINDGALTKKFPKYKCSEDDAIPPNA
ncbi:hypothetical protein H8356DRAFT_1422873 [Neocallimastix lanati (nom. inval.)]|nr:hypothetical protein H8356DRAFT_1422873 [Neocallimastix sp. JGI-2020a]